MSTEKPPYITSPGLVTKVLDKIKQAATPPRFTQDFLNNKLALTGDAANMLIPFLKKMGFLNTDGSPTVIYSRFRNDTESGTAVADAMRLGYKALFEVNEKAHDIGDDALKGLIVQVTGQSKDDQVSKLIFACFKALKNRADFHTVSQLAVSDKGNNVRNRDQDCQRAINARIWSECRGNRYELVIYDKPEPAGIYRYSRF